MSDPAPQLRKQYECWLEILEPDQLSDERIAKQVNSSEVLKKQYAKLVPEVLEHQLFWKRYCSSEQCWGLSSKENLVLQVFVQEGPAGGRFGQAGAPAKARAEGEGTSSNY